MPRVKLPLHFSVPRFFPVDSLRNALLNAHLGAVVASPGPDHVKVTAGKGTCREAVDGFVKGFLAGHSAAFDP